MLGNEKCRLCGDCCKGCLFLFYDEKADLLGCLVYYNKQRWLVQGSYVTCHFLNLRKPAERQRCLDDLFVELEALANGGQHSNAMQRQICDEYNCQRIQKYDEPKYSIREHKVFRDQMLQEAKAQQQCRNLIPKFEALVEILNHTSE